MSTDDAKDSRFAELAAELMGANAAKEIFERVWNSASDESKAELATKIVNYFVERVTVSDRWWWDIERALQSKIQNRIIEELDQRTPKAIEQVDARIAKWIANGLERDVERQIEIVMEAIKGQVMVDLRKQYGLRGP